MIILVISIRKKSKEADFWAGESWRKELIDMLVKPADSILSAFETNDIGIIIADIPSFLDLIRLSMLGMSI